MKTAFVFDLDGTLIHTIEDITDALNRSLREMALPTVSMEEAEGFVGNGMRLICRRALKEHETEENVRRLVGLYSEYYHACCCEHSYAYEGVIETLSRMNREGIEISVSSNKPHRDTVKVISNLLPGIRFNYVLGASDLFPRKPFPDSLLYIVKNMNSESVLYCGDSETDIQYAHNAGLKCVGCTWGYKGEEFLLKNNVDYLIHSFPEIMQFI